MLTIAYTTAPNMTVDPVAPPLLDGLKSYNLLGDIATQD